MEPLSISEVEGLTEEGKKIIENGKQARTQAALWFLNWEDCDIAHTQAQRFLDVCRPTLRAPSQVLAGIDEQLKTQECRAQNVREDR